MILEKQMMKAIVYTAYGPPEVLHLQKVTQPTPAAHEILVKIRATSINYGDLIARRFGHVSPREFNMPGIFWLPARLAFGWRKPKKPTLGSEYAGEVAAVGRDVTQFKVGEAVFGYQGQQMGANAEYLCVPQDGMVGHKPINMSYEEAATVPYGALTALNLLRKADIQPGQKVLINGASGGIGTAAVQLAKHFGAEVTGVCGAPRMDYVLELGADKVIDYQRKDFTSNAVQYDLIFDVLGKGAFADYKKSLTPNGRYLLASFKMKQLLQMAWTSLRGGQKVICALSGETRADLLHIKELVEAGKMKAVVDRRFPLAQTAEAHRYVEAGHKKGSVVIVMGG
jgi:NADPH:quinone reductase-like Zn-dependent oxidoreductase